MSRDQFFSTRRWLIAGLAASAAGRALAAPPMLSRRPVPRPANAPAPRLPSAEGLVTGANLGAARVSFYAADAETGAPLDMLNPDLPQPPASVAKTMTALYALDRLGADFRFATRLIATGPIEGGVLKGDLVLAGSGDPMLDTDRLADLAGQLKAAGVARVEGRLLTWDETLPRLPCIDREQPPQVGYNPGLSGLNLNFNRVYFEWRRAGQEWKVSMDARSERYQPEVGMARMQVVRRSYPIYTYEDAGDFDRWTVASGALGANGTRWLPVRKPTLYTAEVFVALARSMGIALPAAQPVAILPRGRDLATTASADLRSILKDMLKYSTNVTAEIVGLSASASGATRPASLAESAGRMSDWLNSRIGRARPALIDHSGLGGASRISASNLARALFILGPEQDLEPLLKPVGMKDEAGKPRPDHPVKVFAKTGTLNFVSALAGYIHRPDGRRIVFATFMADTARRDAIPVEERERPEGVQGWTARARRLQLHLIERWSSLPMA